MNPLDLSQHLQDLEPSPRLLSQQVQNLAGVDPVLAASLATGVLAPGGYADSGGWQIVTLAARWDVSMIGTPVKAALYSMTRGGSALTVGPSEKRQATKTSSRSGVLEANLWVRSLRYTVRRPNAFTTGANNLLFKAQSDYAFMQNPNIDVVLEFVTPFCRAQVSVPPTPIENMPVSFDTSFPAGFFSREDAIVDCTMVNKRAWSEADDELPVEAIIALHCWRLPSGPYDRFQQEAARALLRGLGYTL